MMQPMMNGFSVVVVVVLVWDSLCFLSSYFLGVHALGSLSLCRVAVEVMNKSLSHISGTPDSLPRWVSVFFFL